MPPTPSVKNSIIFVIETFPFKILNGKFVASQEDFEPKSPNIEEFLEKVDPLLKTDITSRPQVKQYPVKHPCENVKFGAYRVKYAHMTESRTKTDSHEGGDFIQENNLGHVIPFLKKGKIFSQDIFSQAVRTFQHCKDRDSDNNVQKCEQFRRRPKYENEIQSVCATILYKSENPMVAVGLGELHQDVLKISEIGKDNYKKYFLERINAVPTGKIKLRPAFLTKKSGWEYEKLENQPKKEIISQIQKLITQINFDDPQEKIFYENRASKTNTNKCELVNIHAELSQMLLVETDLNLSIM